MNNIKELETLCNNKFKVALEFCQELFADGEVSLRCVAESKALKETLEAKGGKNKTIKLPPSCGPLENRLNSAASFNEKGYAVYYLPQRFKRAVQETYDELISYRAVVIDLDNVPLEPVLKFQVSPTFIVETSKGNYQALWAFQPEVPKAANKNVANRSNTEGATSITDNEFNEFAAALGSLFGADLQTAKGTQCFRLPGFLHQKEDPYESRIIKTGSKVNFDLLKNACALANPRFGRSSSNNGHDRESNQYAGRLDDSTERNDFAYHVSLGDVKRGVSRVAPGERHETTIRLMVSFFHEGKKREEVLELTKQIILSSYEDGIHFIEARWEEVLECLEYAEKYFEKNKERDLQAILAELDKAEKSKSSFKYDFSVGALAVDAYTQTAVAERVVQRFRPDLARINSIFYCFNGLEKIWLVQTSEMYPELRMRILACIKDTVNEKGFLDLCKDAKGKLIEGKRHSLRADFYRASAVNGICKSVVNHMSVPKYEFSDFDFNPDLLFCANGVLDMEKKTIREARNEDRLLCRSKVTWNEAARCPGWIKFLEEVFADNDDPEAMVRFIQELFAYSLSGRMNEQKIFCYQGGGANGKSKTLDALKAISGSYVTILEPDELATKVNSFRSKTFERTGAKVEGKRVVVIDDFEVESVWNESFVKTLTGPELRCRAEYERSRVSPNRAKFHIGLNKAPKPEAENLGILRRLCFVPYQRTFVADPAVSERIDAMIREEASGILRWAVELFGEVKKNSLVLPPETKFALDEYRKENFKLESVIDTLFVVPEKDDQGEKIALSVLLQECEQFIAQTQKHEVKISSELLSAALRQKGFEHSREWAKTTRMKVSFFVLRRKENKTVEQHVQLAVDELLDY